MAAKKKGKRIALAVHAGAGGVTRERISGEEEAAARATLEASLARGREVLADGGSALDAVVAAVCLLEDEPFFNAGAGSVLTSAGTVEMDAAVMNGAGRAAGAVAAVRHLVNPVRAARLVMEKSAHVLLVGHAAEVFAEEHGAAVAEPAHFVTEARTAQLEKLRAKKDGSVALDHDGGGTVGAVARDAEGHLAAATSTGGMANQLPGRVGDTPVIGAGTWADDATCAVSATGQGESFVRSALAHEIDARLRHAGYSIDDACAGALGRVVQIGGRGGCIAVDAAGNIAMPFTTKGMYRGCVVGKKAAQVALFGDEEP